jgi:hypothetical protein
MRSQADVQMNPNESSGESDLGRPSALRKKDTHHDLQLLRDMQIANERTLRENGPMPAGGVPVQTKRKPNLPKRTTPVQTALAVDEIPTDPEGAEMFILGKLFKKRVPREPWPLRFDRFSFDARCYNTLECSVIFINQQHISQRNRFSSSGEPRSPDWKDDWTAGFAIMPSDVFSPIIEIWWTAMDGVARSTKLNFEKIFPDRLVLHNAQEHEVKDGWGLDDRSRRVEILLEVNDRTINVYMRGLVELKQPRDPAVRNSDSLRDLKLAWTKTF